MTYVVAYDIGTTGVKTCLFGLGERIELLASAQAGYGLRLLEGGGAEQDPEAWWQAMGRTTGELFARTEITPEQVAGLSFCSQMQGLVLVDREGRSLRPAMSYMDQRAGAELKKGLAHGPRIAGANVFKLLRCLRATGAVPSSVKDPVWKYKWVQAHEPENFRRVDKWLDVKEYLLLRCTGRAVMTRDSAYATLLYDTRREDWSGALCRMFGVEPAHLAPIIQSTDRVGGLTDRAAAELGLAPGTPVFGGGGDASLIGIGAGAAAVGSQRGRCNYFAEMETAGKCLEWVKDHLALDEIGVYLEKREVTGSQEAVYTSLYDYLTETVARVPPGSGGVLFTPWLHGNRCPFEDPAAAGMFFNIRLNTGKSELIRAVLEGVCFHLRWMLECQAGKTATSDPIRFVGGGALSPVTAQILADITGRTVETVASPQNAGSVGAAAVMAVGLGLLPDLEGVGALIPPERVFRPNGDARAVYEKSFAVFQRLYRANRSHFRALNG